MVRPCAVKGCDSNHRQYSTHREFKISNRRTVFNFPKNRPELYLRWVEFVNADEDKSLESLGVCILHFEQKYVTIGKRATLKWELNPIPTIVHAMDPLVNSTEIELKEFEDLNADLCPPGYEFRLVDGNAIFFRIATNIDFNIPEIVETISIDRSLHVRLFLKSAPIPLPEWFRSKRCRITRKSILENLRAQKVG